ncbi:MAG: DUF1080 domain-containing protein [Bacteroidales bacterium]
MKKIFLTIGFMLATVGMISAQLDAGRTVKTKVIDAIAVTPAQNSPAYSKLIEELALTGTEGLQELTSLYRTATGEMRVKLEFLLSSLAVYAAQNNQSAFAQELQQSFIREVKASGGEQVAPFYLEQLKLTSNDACVDLLSAYLQDENLGQHVAAILSAIHTPKAGKALNDALAQAKPKQMKYLIASLAEMQYEPSEELLINSLISMPESDRNVVYAALAACGSEKSLPILKQAAKDKNFTYDRDAETAALLLLCERIALAGNAKAVRKVASELIKQAEKKNDSGLLCAAFSLQSVAEPNALSANVLRAIESQDRALRNAALQQPVTISEPKTTNAILKKIRRADNETRADIFNWAAVNKLETGLSFITPYVNDPSEEVAESAIRTIGLIGGEGAIASLSDLVKSGTSRQIGLAKEVLSYTQGNISEPLMRLLPDANPEGRAAILSLVGSKKDTGFTQSFFASCGDENPTVRQAALSQLRHVVTPTHIPDLFSMLHAVPSQDVKNIQVALINALKGVPSDQRFVTVQNKMNSSDSKELSRYFRLLTAVPGPKALALVEKGMQTEGQTQMAAIEALCEWDNTDALEPLYTLCSDANYESHAARAWDAYVSKVNKSAFTKEKKLIFLRKALSVAKTNEQRRKVLQQLRKTDVYPAIFVAADYLNDADLREEACQSVMNIALNHPEYAGEEVNALLRQVSSLLDNPDKGYQQQAIDKYLAENKNKRGFVSLFNGKDLTGWKGLVGNPLTRSKMTPAQLKKSQQTADEAMRSSWQVEDGMLVFTGNGDNICTDRPYGDFEMYVDWCLDSNGPEPDAGIYLRGTPQVQMWDTSRVNVGAQVGSGGLYNNQKNISTPAKVADNKLGEWNSFFIRMKGERVSVWLNGEQVVNNVILENYWDRNLPVPMLEQIELQAHGSRVAYRDIYLREIPRSEPFVLSDQEKKEGFRVLFDGTSMINWTGNTQDYIVEDGCIALYPQNKGGGNLYTKEEYDDFVFRFEFQLTPGANNGLGIRTPMKGDAAYVGMELQILDNEAPVYSTLKEYQYHGSVYGVIPAKRGFLKETGEWNTQEVIAKGDHLRIILNGEVILDGNIREAGGNGTADKRNHPGLFNKTGHIAFLGHGSEVKFRNIRVKPLK